MPTLQNDIEKIIQKNINKMAGQKLAKRSLHIAHHYHDLLGELYEKDPDAVVFINHFGHIEYHNSAFAKMMMLDKHNKTFNNIHNMDQLAINFELIDGRLHVTYPNEMVVYMDFSHKLVNFQKSVLLKLTFKDTSQVHKALADLKAYRRTANYYLTNLNSPMFIVNSEGIIIHAPKGKLKLFGKSLHQLTNESIFEVLPFDYANEMMEKTKNITIKTNAHFMYQVEKDKIITVYDTTVLMLSDATFLCQLTDVSDLNTMSSTIEYLNSYDSLTGFYNATYYENLVSSLKDYGHLPMGVYTLTLHGLKQVNMRLGHHQCDNLLIEIALNIKSLTSQHDIPCRITGDTFIVFFPNCSQKTMDKFGKKMDQFIESYKKNYNDYYLTYSDKALLITDHVADINALISGIIL